MTKSIGIVMFNLSVLEASRAVGTALKKNPVGLIIPCHRVVRSNGTTGNYAGGKLNIVKEWLLEYEKAQ